MEFKLFHTVRPLPSLMNKQFTNNLQASVFCFRMKWGCWTFLLPSWCEEHQLIFPSPLPGKGFIQSSKTLSERYSWNNTFFFFFFWGWSYVDFKLESYKLEEHQSLVIYSLCLQPLSKCCTGSWGSPAVVAGSEHKPGSNSWNRNHCRQPKVSLPPTAAPVLGGCKSLDNFLVYVGDQNYWNCEMQFWSSSSTKEYLST